MMCPRLCTSEMATLIIVHGQSRCVPCLLPSPITCHPPPTNVTTQNQLRLPAAVFLTATSLFSKECHSEFGECHECGSRRGRELAGSGGTVRLSTHAGVAQSPRGVSARRDFIDLDEHVSTILKFRGGEQSIGGP